MFMEELGITESSLDRVIALSYRLLGLVSFLTAGPDEVRAWPIHDGSTAVDAAGAIHTDLAKGFIRAETGRLRRPAHARARWPRRRRPAGCARRARPTGSRTGTCSRSCSAADRREALDSIRRPRSGSNSARIVRKSPVSSSPGSSSSSSSSSSVVGLELGEEVVRLLGRHVDGGGQALVADEDEAVVALEDGGDRLDRACPARSRP